MYLSSDVVRRSRGSVVLWLCAAMTVMSAGQLAYANRDAADTTNALGLLPGGSYGYSLTGAGVTVGVFEAGSSYLVRDTHQEFLNPDGTSRVTLYGTGGYSTHATGVAGTIGGNGIGGSQYKGMAPEVSIRSYGSGSVQTYVNQHASVLNITNHSYSTGSNAWDTQTWTIPGVGDKSYRTWYDTSPTLYRDVYNQDPRYGRYDSNARTTDTVFHDNPQILAFYSAGNGRGSQYDDLQNDGKYVARFSAGVTPTGGISLGNQYWLISTANYPAPGGSYDGMAGVQVAKNTVIVGASLDYTTDPHPTTGITTNIITSFTNFGPTDDGRLGVTIMANGNSLETPTSTSDTAYQSISGTSLSSPNAAGTAALLLQHWRNKTGGYTPLAATQKALIVHAATDITSGGGTKPGPDYVSGYGLMDGYKSVKFIDEATSSSPTRTAHWMEASIRDGEEFHRSFTAITGTEIRATLVWTDPEGTTHTGFNDRTKIALVNDLDLSIIDSLGRTFYPWTLDPDNPSAPAVRTTRNNVDNIEQVLVDANSITGMFWVRVSIDGVLLSGLPQNYSLLVSGAQTYSQVVPEAGYIGLLVFPTLLISRPRPRL